MYFLTILSCFTTQRPACRSRCQDQPEAETEAKVEVEAHGNPLHLIIEVAGIEVQQHIAKEVKVDEFVHEVQRIHFDLNVRFKRCSCVAILGAAQEADFERRDDRYK